MLTTTSALPPEPSWPVPERLLRVRVSRRRQHGHGDGERWPRPYGVRLRPCIPSSGRRRNTGQFATGTDIGDVGAAGGEAFDELDRHLPTRERQRHLGDRRRVSLCLDQGRRQFRDHGRVDAVQNVNAWTKAGIMIRATSILAACMPRCSRRRGRASRSSGARGKWHQRTYGGPRGHGRAGVAEAPAHRHLVIAYYRKATTMPGPRSTRRRW